jgi:hypothetical protein
MATVQFKDVKAVAAVKVFLVCQGSMNCSLTLNKNNSTITATAYILEQVPGQTILGFQAGDIRPTNFPSLEIKQEWKDKGIDWIYRYNNFCYCEFEAAPLRTEGPCKQCKRTNDIGCKSCWWCAILNPC